MLSFEGLRVQGNLVRALVVMGAEFAHLGVTVYKIRGLSNAGAGKIQMGMLLLGS